jgi:hypothetical protein
MNTEGYDYQKQANNLIYVFYSIGTVGIIPKVVVYEKIEGQLFNLAFGDYNIKTGELDDEAVSNNGDMIKVLATVIQTIRDFFNLYPNATVMIRGSTTLRTKLYTKIIRDNIALIEQEYSIKALKKGRWSFKYLILKLNT